MKIKNSLTSFLKAQNNLMSLSTLLTAILVQSKKNFTCIPTIINQASDLQLSGKIPLSPLLYLSESMTQMKMLSCFLGVVSRNSHSNLSLKPSSRSFLVKHGVRHFWFYCYSIEVFPIKNKCFHELTKCVSHNHHKVPVDD